MPLKIETKIYLNLDKNNNFFFNKKIKIAFYLIVCFDFTCIYIEKKFRDLFTIRNKTEKDKNIKLTTFRLFAINSRLSFVNKIEFSFK